MMPTFPLPSLKFRTAGFPRHGLKAGGSDESFPASRFAFVLRAGCRHRDSLPCVKDDGTGQHLRAGGVPPYPRGPRSGPGYVVPVPPHLSGPIRPTRRRVPTVILHENRGQFVGLGIALSHRPGHSAGRKSEKLRAEVVEFALEDGGLVETNLLRGELTDNNLECSIIGLYVTERDLASRDAGQRGSGIKYSRKSRELAAESGAALFSGDCVGVGGKEVLSEEGRTTSYRRAAECLHETGEFAATVGVRFCVEILNRYEDNLLKRKLQPTRESKALDPFRSLSQWTFEGGVTWRFIARRRARKLSGHEPMPGPDSERWVGRRRKISIARQPALGRG